MKLSPCAGSSLMLAVAIACAAALVPASARAQDVGPSATTALYVRTDSDRTTVVTPRVHVNAPVGESTRVDLVYTIDAWSSASIDIRTSASRRLDVENMPRDQEPVREQRDEIDAGLQQAFGDVTLSGGYRYSTEPDYQSHGGSLDGTYEFADNNATLSLGARAFFDRVGRAGDPDFDKPSSTLSARAAFGQLLGTHSLVQLVYEFGLSQGYLSSPYRYVRFAPDRGVVPSTCVYPVGDCFPEENPSSRTRNAVALYARHAFGDRISFGAHYRFYIDDWEMTSHTAAIDGAYLPGDDWLISLGYRLYHQSGTFFFEPFYAPMPRPRHYTSDKELSSLTSHRVELELAHTFTLDEPGTQLRIALGLAPTFFVYHEFLPLDSVDAFESTVTVGVVL